MLKFIIILTVAVVAATAYDFKDAYFNQYLLEDFQSLNSNFLSRQRRDAEETPTEGSAEKGSHCGGRNHDWIKDFTCCHTLKAEPSFFDKVREAKHSCAAKLRENNPDVEHFDPFNCTQMENIKELIFCESECVAKTLGHMDDEGHLQMDAIHQALKEQFPEAEEAAQKQVFSYVDTCIEKLKDKDLKPEGKCNQMPIEMHHCMFGEMILGCPAESQIQNHHCDRMRESFGSGQKKSIGRHALFEFMHSGKHHHGDHKHGKE